MNAVTLSSKFQLSLPKALREELSLKAGQKFLVMAKGDVVTLVPQRDMAWARGLLKGARAAEPRSREDRQARPAAKKSA